MKLELGSGNKPTIGYLHQDIIKVNDYIDFVCKPYEVNLSENSLDEVIAVGVMEHLGFTDFRKTIAHVYRLLVKDGIFLFDVPDLMVWSEYLYKVLRHEPVPFEREHILSTIWGWQRWEGDEHRSGWTRIDIYNVLTNNNFNFFIGNNIIQEFKDRGIYRTRFERYDIDAHIYVKAIKK